MSYKRISGIPVTEGGTGLVTGTTAYGVVCAGTTATGNFQVLNSLGSSTQVLTSNGAGALPTWQAASGSGVPSIAGTTNQISESGSPGATTLSIPTTFTPPGVLLLAGKPASSTVGIIQAQDYQAGAWTAAPFLHNYGGDSSGNHTGMNTFVGWNAGNFTLTAGTARSNTAVGSANVNTSGVMFKLTSGSYNTSIGADSALDLSSGSGNSFFGAYAGEVLTTGSNNLLLGGYNGTGSAGLNYTSSESNNCCINAYGTVATSNQLVIGQGTGTGTWQFNSATICGIYGSANSGTQNLAVIDSNNVVGSSTSTSVTGSLTLTTFLSAGTLLKLPTTTTTAGQLTINATPVLHSLGTDNIFLGTASHAAGNLTLTATQNVCIGSSAGSAITGASNCTYVGYQAGMNDATTGGDSGNVALGKSAFTAFTGAGTARNTALGTSSLTSLLTGKRNISLGYSSSSAYVGAESDNIIIGSGVTGVASESNVLRMGTGTGTGSGNLNASYICGIQGITVTGTAVLVSSSDQLGIAVSSKRYKDNIAPMGDYSSKLMDLNPVTFNYNVGEDHSLQSGLIAEEVYEVMPNLVVLDKEGLPQTVKYHDLPALLLNEIQKLSSRIEELERKLNGKN